MEVCSLDDGIESSFWRNHGPRNESVIAMITRTYTGLCDRVYKPPRKNWDVSELERNEDFTVELFNLRTSKGETLSCAFFELCDPEEAAFFRDAGGDEDTVTADGADGGGAADGAAAGAAAADGGAAGGASAGEDKQENDQEEDKDLLLHDTILIYMHTNCVNLADATEVLPVCKRLGCPLLAYDLRGHGKSSGDGIADIDTNLLDLERVVDWSRSKARRVVLWSRGLSTCVSVEFTRKLQLKERQVNSKLSPNSFIRFESPIKYLVLDSPFLSVEKLLKDAVTRIHATEFDYIPKNLFDLAAKFFRRSIRKRTAGMDPFSIKPVDHVPELSCPASILIPTGDDFIPVYHGTEMAAAYGSSATAGDDCTVFARIFQTDHFTARPQDVVLGVTSHLHSHILP